MGKTYFNILLFLVFFISLCNSYDYKYDDYNNNKYDENYGYYEIIVYGWQKILENITSGFGHHEWKYWIYHEWPKATSDKSNIFTSDDQNHE